MADEAAIREQIKSTQRDMVAELVSAVKKPSFNVPKPSLIMFGKECTEGYWRYLEQCGWDLENALRLIQSAYEWQRKSAPTVRDICKTLFQKNPGFLSLRQVGFDKVGRPVLYCSASQNTAKPSELAVDAVIAHLVHVAENAGKSNKQQNVAEEGRQNVLVLDCAGFNPAYFSKPDTILKVYQTMCLLYPNTISTYLVANYTQEVRNTWSALKSSFNEAMQAKVKFVPATATNVTMSEHFGFELAHWMVEELKLNREVVLPASQVTFYRKNAGHDPRGSSIYVDNYLDKDGFVEGHQPHGGIMFGAL